MRTSTTTTKQTATSNPASAPIVGHCHIDHLSDVTYRAKVIVINAEATRAQILSLLAYSTRSNVPAVVIWRGTKTRAKAEAIVAWGRSHSAEYIEAAASHYVEAAA